MKVMGKSLTDKLKIGFASMGLAGALSGCIGPMYSAIGAGATAQGNKFGSGISAFGDGMTKLEAAEEGRSNTNITVNNRNDPQPQNGAQAITPQRQSPEEQKIPLVHTYAEDGPNYTEIGIGKQIFYAGETVLIMADGSLSNGGILTNYNKHLPTGKCSPLIRKTNAIKIGWRTPVGFDAQGLINAYGEGEFENVWFLNGKEVGRVRYAVFKKRE